MNWQRVVDAVRTGGLTERRQGQRRGASDEWAERERAILSDPIGQMLWTTMANHGLSLNSRTPIYGWQVQHTYVKTVEAMLTALDETQGTPGEGA